MKQSDLNLYLIDLAGLFKKHLNAFVDDAKITSHNGSAKLLLTYKKANSKLTLETFGPELTFTFGKFHWHISKSKRKSGSLFQEILQDILAVIGNEVIDISGRSGKNERAGSTYFGMSEESALEEFRVSMGGFSTNVIKTWQEKKKTVNQKKIRKSLAKPRFRVNRAL